MCVNIITAGDSSWYFTVLWYFLKILRNITCVTSFFCYNFTICLQLGAGTYFVSAIGVEYRICRLSWNIKSLKISTLEKQKLLSSYHLALKCLTLEIYISTYWNITSTTFLILSLLILLFERAICQLCFMVFF
jgi:hypothetical protein